MTSTVSGASNTARRAARSDTITRIGRVGLIAYGVVNLLIAFLAIKVATGESGGEEANKNGALSQVAETPFGQALLWIITIGLVALTVWQIAEAIWGHASAGDRRTIKRLTSAGEAALFGFLAFTAGKFAMGTPQHGSKTESLTGKLLEQPFGRALVVVLGLAIIGIAAFVVRRGWAKRFRDDLDLSHADARARRTAERLGQVGYMAVGVAYGVVGALVVTAAVTFDKEKASGLDGAMKTISDQPYGALLLWLVALGFICYGVYCFFDARYRKS
ncbi:DUF1206 domain-containing protein [Cryptosporangium aurantiacum]|uniref:DUF1206 domain-containing protein n=1 Tax=Cryptosporangium aurantiacum TaxID=134849 RepID=A0A1M7QTV9_9ACTN|nr:DUF1206 domain-containing protein [Cryptosporangium aurantiacum]SHN35205.1 protein of unknown function [Cryptosporangium aurantiacum]